MRTLIGLLLGLALYGTALGQEPTSVAVIDFRPLKPGWSPYGAVVADAFAKELKGAAGVNVLPRKAVDNTITILGLDPGPQTLVGLARIGAEIRAETTISGEIVECKVRVVGGERQALVQVRAVAYETATALPLNGAIETAQSGARKGATDDVLISDALHYVARKLIRTMQERVIVRATVARTNPSSSEIDRGARAGFKVGDRVVVVRDRITIAMATLTELWEDHARIVAEKTFLGIAVGDRVRTLYTPPPLPVITHKPQ